MKKNVLAWIFFILVIIQLFGVYKILAEFETTRYSLETPIDKSIPFVSFFIIPYFFLFPGLIISFLYTRKYFFEVSLTFLITTTIVHLIFILFPTVMVRPEIVPRNLFDSLVVFLYNHDAPTNLFPSGHVTYSLLGTLIIYDTHKKIGLWIIPWTLLLILSTLFIKQHVLLDVILGIIIAVLCYYFYKVLKSKKFDENLVSQENKKVKNT